MSVTDLVSLAKLQSRETYDVQIQTVKNRLRYYKDSMQIKTSDRVIDGLRFYGIWANGKMTGIFECYSNDKMKIHKYKTSFVDGIFDGEMTTYYESKNIKTRQFYKQGQLEGKFVGYHENGQLSELCTFKEGKKEGYWQVFYENGQLCKEGLIKNGKDIFINVFHGNGNIAYQHLFTSMGKLYSSYAFNRKGEMTYCGKMVNNAYSGESLVFYRNTYYAKCIFINKYPCVNNQILAKKRSIKWTELDALFDKDNSLDASPIPWKPIREIVNDVPQHHEVMNVYEGKSHVVQKNRLHDQV